MEKMAGMLADRFYHENSFPTVSYESFKYVVEFILEISAGVLASVVIAAILGMKWETSVFLFIFWILRSYAGGIHLDKFSHCFVFSVFVIAGTMILVKYLHVSFWFSHFMLSGGMIAFLLTPPENDRNRAVDEEEDTYFKKKLLQSLFAIAISYLLYFTVGNGKYMFLIALTVDIVYVLMIMGKVKNGKNK